MADPLSHYQRKRNFAATPEPSGETQRKKSRGSDQALSFVIQKHDARRLHYDFRLELEGTLKSWAVPKGPSLDPNDKRLAVHVEDHPLEYANFEGSIPAGHYGAGDVIVWDHGIWQPHGDPAAAYQQGKLKFTLVGEKLSGDWTLVRTHLRGSGDKEQWLLIKERDGTARPASDYDIVQARPESVLSTARITEKKPKSSTATSTKAKAKPRKASVALPDSLTPELATLVDRPPPGDWLYEIKFDGYRMLARISEDAVRLYTRKGNDWTARLSQQAQAIAGLGLHDSWLDGEVVVLNDKGLPDFQALQNAFDLGRSQEIVYYLFDAPFLQGEDLRERPVEERRAALQQALMEAPQPLLRFSEAFQANHHDILASACAMSLEGVIGKRAGSAYLSRRSPDWIKLKCRLRQEFVIVGYSKPKGSRSGFGALLLAVNDEDGLRYAGRVGTGFNEHNLKTMHAQMRKLERPDPPITDPPRGVAIKDVHWIEPQLVGEVEFAEWTREGIVRQAAFIALRSDKPAEEIVHERAVKPAELKKRASQAAPSDQQGNPVASSPVAGDQVAGIRISNPQRVIDPESGATKIDLARFYASIAEWILPKLDNRPVSLLRAPDGISGEQFFQKHAARLAIPHIKHLDPALDRDHDALMEIDSLQALIGTVQMGTIELHTWGATHDRIETPDHFVLDLDPDPALPWRSMLEAAQLTLTVLDELKLAAFLKTSGGKGLHIIVPLGRRDDWDAVKTFSKAIAQFMTRQLPERFTATSGPKNRVGKIFIDYLRNQRGASTVCAYSVRARPGLPVSVPIAREELAGLHSSNQWTIHNLHKRLDSLQGDPWKGYANRQRITQAMWKQLGVKD